MAAVAVLAPVMPAGLRVLLAGHNTADLRAAQSFLTSKGIEAIVSSSGEHARSLIKQERFDVAVIEVKSRQGSKTATADAVDALELLKLKEATPIAVALDFEKDGPSMVAAVQLGAVDILQTPVSKQQDRLATLWQHTLRRNSSSVSDGSVLDSCAFSGLSQSASDASTGNKDRKGRKRSSPHQAGDALCKAFLAPCVFDDDDSDGPGSENDSSGDVPETTDMYKLLAQEVDNCEANGMDDYNLFDSEESLADTEFAMSFSSMDSSLQVTEASGLDGLSGLRRVLSETMTVSTADESYDKRNKKLKVEWTQELHDRFVRAVDHLGAEKAVPSKIKEMMGAAAAGLTRQNIASHLQKYRNRKRHRASALCGKSAVPSHLPPLLPAPLGSPMPFWAPVLPPFTMPGGCTPAGQQMPTSAMPAACAPAPGMLMAPCGPQWTGFVPLMPTPQQPGTQGSQGGHGPPGAEDISNAISQVLQQPRQQAPLGLKLDANSVLEHLNQEQPTKVCAAT